MGSRNYFWGAWKDHHPNFALVIEANTVVLGGLADRFQDAGLFKAEARYAEGRDITVKATGTAPGSGCVIAGTYDDGAHPPSSFKPNDAIASTRLTIKAQDQVTIPAN